MRSIASLFLAGWLLAGTCPLALAASQENDSQPEAAAAKSHAQSSLDNLQAALAKARAGDVLRNCGKLYSGFKTFRTQLVSTTTLYKGDEKTEERSTTYDVTAERPGKLAIVLKEGPGIGTAVTGGAAADSATAGDAYCWFAARNAYTKTKAPASYRSLMDTTSYRLTVGYALGSSLIDFLLDERADEIFQRLAARMTYVGQEVVDGAECHRMRLNMGPFYEDVFIDSGKKPWLRKVIMDVSAVGKGQKIEGTTGGDETPSRRELTINYHNLAIDETLDNSNFAYTPPPGAQLVTSFAPERKERKEEVHPLVGKPAPNCTLKLLDSNPVTLASLRGRKVIVLDFWATWCGPCRRALPLVAEVAQTYRPKGVEFYAVDLQESADEVRGFAQDHALSLPIALDSDGKIADQFQAQAIPQTVIIGKDGIIREVHVGYKPNLNELLVPLLDKLLAQSVRIPAPTAIPPAKAKPAATKAPIKGARPAVRPAAHKPAVKH